MTGRSWAMWGAGALGVVLLAVVAVWLVLPLKEPSGNRPSAEVALPADVPYEFVWPEGAIRGVDMPAGVVVPGLEEPLPIFPVGDLSSEAGEDKIAFLQRVRHEMVAYSDRQTHEACAQICTDGSAYSVRMTTVAATTYCVVADVCIAGHVSVHETIHSHCPHRGNLRATLADQYLSGGRRREGRPFGMCDTDKFSKTDFQGWRPGWLAGVHALYRHDGPGNVTAYR